MYEVDDTLFISVPSEDETDNPWLKGPWRPQGKEWSVSGDNLTIIGKVPHDLNGIYIRNSHNNATMPTGVYHPFDGDGMLQAMRFDDGKVEYRNKFVRTTGFLAEQGAKKALWPGLLQPNDYQRRGWGSIGSMKDNAGTDVVVHAGKVYASMSQGSEPWCLSPTTLETYGVNKNWARFVPDGLASHYKVDNETGDMIFFNYPENPPYMNYGVINREDNLIHYVPIELPGARMPHDLGMTKNYSILHDLPYFFDAELLKEGTRKSVFHTDMPARFGIIPRFGRSEDVKWFEAKPCWVMHLSNCYEDGDWVVQDGCLWDNPVKPPHGKNDNVYDRIARGLDKRATNTHMYRWMFNMRTGEVKEFELDDEVTEFPTISNDYIGRGYRYSYNAIFNSSDWVMDGIKRFDLLAGTAERYEYGEGRYGSEVCVAMKDGFTTEDQAYVITFLNDMVLDRSECLVFDAANITAGPICTIILPERISAGTHACWVEGDRIEAEERGLKGLEVELATR
ncbi:carotenoid oxygenase family protein [Homoserinimonas sp. A520]